MPPAPPGAIPLARPEPIVCVDQIGYVRFAKSDFASTKRFFTDFGLVLAHESDERLLYRGSGSAPYIYIAEHAPAPAFIGSGFVAANRADLDELARATGQRVAPIDRPGGGECVHLTDPLGFAVDVVFGIEPVAPLPTRTEPLPLNTPFAKPRVNLPQRPPLEPTAVARLGHCVIQTPRFAEVAAWYMRHLGLIPTDVLCLPDGRPALAFLRTDRGSTPADHHTVVVGTGTKNGYLHCAFEALDIDSVAQGQQMLKAGGWRHAWGVGRHLLGSQLFDYWHDPDGFEVEHYADGDVFDASHPTAYRVLDRGGLWQWGADLPGDFVPQLGPGMLVDITRGLLAGDFDFATLKQLGAAMAKAPRPWLR